MRILTALFGAILLLFLTTGAASVAAPSSGSALLEPTWDRPQDVDAAVRAARLTLFDMEQTAVHYHAHLDIIVYGQHVTVPALIGIDDVRNLVSSLHTHDTTGIVHIEAPADVPFTLGQFFTEWGQQLTADQIGPIHLTRFETAQLYVNGVRFQADPASYRFAAHDEIALIIGTR